jgi:hypothetical protein
LMVLVLSWLLIGCTSIPASELDCDDVASHAEGGVLTNAFGAEFKILKVRNAIEVSRNDTKLVCEGDAMMSNGSDDTLMMTYEQDSDGDWWLKMESE